MQNMKIKQSVHYNGKKYKLPFLIAKETLNTEMETISNPFSGQSIAIPKFAVAVYDVIIGSNHIAEQYDSVHGWGSSPEWNTVRKGLDWFRKYFAEEYMVLLD
jgi:hypothetical protein